MENLQLEQLPISTMVHQSNLPNHAATTIPIQATTRAAGAGNSKISPTDFSSKLKFGLSMNNMEKYKERQALLSSFMDSFGFTA